MFIPTILSFEIKTDANRDAVMTALKSKISNDIFSLFPRNLFVGTVDDMGFDVKESVWYPRTYNPSFRGCFHTADDGLIVSVKASNSFTTLTVITGWPITALFLTVSFWQFFGGRYLPAALAAIGSVAYGACTFYVGRLYKNRLSEGRRKLISIVESAKLIGGARGASVSK